MSATAQRMRLAEAEAIAARFVEAIEPYCERVVVAGSIRRRTATVNDIKIVAVPRVEPVKSFDMFGDVVATEQTDRLDQLLVYQLGQGTVTKRETNGKTAWGPKHKRLAFEGAPVDLFCCDAERLGVILAIRTGPYQYSHQMVTEKGKTVVVGQYPDGRLATRVGLLPPHLRVQGGWLTSRVSGQRIFTPEETDFYDWARIPWIEPEERR